jgi:tRNA (mo5U34)-methyltransferase
MNVRERVDALEWYHTLELAPGIVTPGWFDTRPIAGVVPIPADLTGKRCLDIGTFDGFWAFEMERRGAAEVVAIDVLDPARWDWPAGSEQATMEAIGRRKARGAGFVLAAEALGSSVTRNELSIYELDPEQIGRFDVIYLGSLLLHLRDPVGALEKVRAVCRGELVVVDAIDVPLSRHRRPLATLDAVGRPWWWKPNPAGLRKMVEAAAFEVVRGPEQVFIPVGTGQNVPKLPLRSLIRKAAREVWSLSRRGDPHAALLARPAGIEG